MTDLLMHGKHSNFSLTEIETLMPWEIDVYLSYIKQRVEADEQQQQST